MRRVLDYEHRGAKDKPVADYAKILRLTKILKYNQKNSNNQR